MRLPSTAITTAPTWTPTPNAAETSPSPSLHRSCGVTLKPRGAPAPSPHTHAYPAKRHKDGAERRDSIVTPQEGHEEKAPLKKNRPGASPLDPIPAPARVLRSWASPLAQAPPSSLRTPASAPRTKGKRVKEQSVINPSPGGGPGSSGSPA